MDSKVIIKAPNEIIDLHLDLTKILTQNITNLFDLEVNDFCSESHSCGLDGSSITLGQSGRDIKVRIAGGTPNHIYLIPLRFQLENQEIREYHIYVIVEDAL